MVIPYRHPGLTARGLTSVDQASNGRFTVVVGSGWAPSEFDVLKLPFDERGPMTDEYVDAMRTLWTENHPSYSGKYVEFPPTTFEPKCVQKPHVPLWIGGSGPAAVRRMREYGSGWAPMVASLEDLRDTIARMKEDVAGEGRDASKLGFSYGMTYGEGDPYQEVASGEVTHAVPTTPQAWSADEAVDIIESYADAGITRIQVQGRWDTPDMLIGLLERFAAEVMPRTANL
jgi:probable F420-dependent oxidoreductase